jgi:DNA-binding beta-propeller fold protein YncE
MEKRFYHFLISAIGAPLVFFVLTFPPTLCAQEQKAYVSAQDATRIFVFDLARNALIKTIPVFTPSPLGRALPPNINDALTVGGRVFVSVPGPEVSPQGIHEIKVIDVKTDTIIKTLKTDMTPSGLVSYKGRVYVVNRYGNTVQEIDPGSLEIIRTIPYANPKSVPMNNPVSLEIASDKIYLPFPGGLSRPAGILVLSLKTGEPLKFIDFSAISHYGPVAVKKAGDEKIYLGGARNVAVLDTRVDEIVKTVPVSTQDVYVESFARQGNRMYAATAVSTVSIIDLRTDSFVKEIDIGSHSYAHHLRAGICAAGNRIYVADAGRGFKTIDALTDRLIAVINTQEPLGPIALAPE